MFSIFNFQSAFKRFLLIFICYLRNAVQPIAVRNKLAARIYYAFLTSRFNREQQAFLAGRKAYTKALTCPLGNSALLRRNIHRLEKGLLMKPRRLPFARDYINETMQAFIAAKRLPSSEFDTQEIAWAEDVLHEYFRLHTDFAEVKLQKDTFLSIICENTKPSRLPYYRDLEKPLPISITDLTILAKRRRSVRWFLSKPVERHLLDQALEVGIQAPSACNRQPFKVQIFDEKSLVQEVINIPYGLNGYGHNVPVVAVVIGQQRHFFEERDRHLIYIDASLATMGFILALETLGLSSCCVNWPDIEDNEKKMATLLNLAPDERPIMLIAMGYPDPKGMVANSTKKSLTQIRQYNFE